MPPCVQFPPMRQARHHRTALHATGGIITCHMRRERPMTTMRSFARGAPLRYPEAQRTLRPGAARVLPAACTPTRIEVCTPYSAQDRICERWWYQQEAHSAAQCCTVLLSAAQCMHACGLAVDVRRAGGHVHRNHLPTATTTASAPHCQRPATRNSLTCTGDWPCTRPYVRDQNTSQSKRNVTKIRSWHTASRAKQSRPRH